MKKEDIIKAIDENIAIYEMTHRVGSHSDCSGGEDDYPCDCDKERNKYAIEALEALKLKINPLPQDS